MCRISGAARYEIGRGGGGREKKKEKWSRANAEPLHHRGRRGDDNRKVVSFRGKKKILVLLLAFLTLFESHLLVSICPS